MNASQSLNKFDGDWADFRSWLFAIAYQRIADTHRRSYRVPA